MKVLLFLIPLITFVSSFKIGQLQTGPYKYGIGNRIINGTLASSGQIPWIVHIKLVRSQDTADCSGVLIHPQWVLTSASCAVDYDRFRLTLGVIDLEDYSSPTRVNVSASVKYIHPDFVWDTLDGDLALIELLDPLPLSDYVQPIPILDAILPDDQYVNISGWGKINPNDVDYTYPHLQYANLYTLPHRTCEQFYGSLIEELLCAIGTRSEISPCGTDAGGPMVVLQDNIYYLYAIHVFGSSHGCEVGEPSGWLRIAPYLDWIRFYIPDI